MTRPKPPRVLAGYDPEHGHLVLGTHDADEARRLLLDDGDTLEVLDLDRGELGARLDSLAGPRLTYVRIAPALPGSWAREEYGLGAYEVHTASGPGPGATRAVAWYA